MHEFTSVEQKVLRGVFECRSGLAGPLLESIYERKYGRIESKKMMLEIASKCARTHSRTVVARGGPSRASVNGVHYIEVYCICDDLCQYRAGTLVPSSIVVHASHKICRLPALSIFQP